MLKIIKAIWHFLYIFLYLLFGVIYVPCIILLLLICAGIILFSIAAIIVFIPFYYVYYVIKNGTFEGLIAGIKQKVDNKTEV
jgi:Fe2+ transport system protein B